MPTVASRPPLVSLERVSRSFVTRRFTVDALAGVSLAVGDGEFVSVVGPSGCGKTTLLRLMAGLLDPTGGSVARSGDLDRAGGIGMVFQAPTLLPWRTVLGNVLLTGELAGLDRDDAERRASELLELVGLDGFAGALPRQLSGGMQQRVALCRALLTDPPLLLLDEPFGSLDAITRETMGFELQRVWLARHTTTVLVTHSIPEAVLLSDRVVVLTARPATVAGVVDVPLERPRSMASVIDPAYQACTGAVRRLIEDGG